MKTISRLFIFVSFLFFSCHSQKEIVPDYYEVEHKKIRIIDIDKKKKYYNIKGINILGDTLVFISDSRNTYSRTNINERVLTKLTVDGCYVLDVVQLYPRAQYCGSLNAFSIKVGNYIIWKGFYRDMEQCRNKYFRILDDYYVIKTKVE